MPLEDDVDAAYKRLSPYEKTHPNLTHAWKRRIVDDIIALYKTLNGVEVAVGMFEKYPDVSLHTMALVHAFFRVCRPNGLANCASASESHLSSIG